MVAKPVSLREVVDTLDSQDDDMSGFIEPETGIVGLQMDDLDLSELGVDEERIVYLPSRWDLHDLRMMRTWARSLDDPEARGQVLRALEGRGAYRRFRDTVRRLGLLDAWYEERQRRLTDIAVEVLREAGIPFE